MMSMRRVPLFVLVAACGGGPAANSGMATDGYEPPGEGRDSPGNARDPAGDRETPPPSQDPPISDREPPGGTTACFVCEDLKFECTGLIEGLPVQNGVSIHFRSRDGQCVTEDNHNGNVTITSIFVCGGKITNASGVVIGTWSNAANGGITVTLEGIQLTCLPKAQTPVQNDAGTTVDGGR
jgi:hypothetical protein